MFATVQGTLDTSAVLLPHDCNFHLSNKIKFFYQSAEAHNILGEDLHPRADGVRGRDAKDDQPGYPRGGELAATFSGAAMDRILVVEDDNLIRATTKILLEDEGYLVEEAPTGKDGLAVLGAVPLDCVLLDLRLPDHDGLEVCRSIRQVSAVPVIVVTARAETYDVVAGLEAGADDYVTKPFQPRELVARIGAQLRRNRRGPVGRESLRIRDLAIDVVDGTVFRGSDEIP